ncbi:hypothetical protein GS597_07080 [Synechococcales cyanobacterium C]|uniref:YopA central domain-containing protein n=1 Tax=Petrachloros mirabilis ULC683 TaxID=2781853 RepID=A0A8K1ZYI4_9CYAN|nr:hypothetical protein [Petrachloros mirabilis]NCJ06278.1 hypothetical protein [Petrachloros mirabilis ULC683]
MNLHENYSRKANELPISLSPVYFSNKVNESILLFEGDAKLIEESESSSYEIEGKLKIEYLWLPFPRLGFRFESDINNEGKIPFSSENKKIIHFQLNSKHIIKSEVDLCSQSTQNRKLTISGNILDSISYGENEPVKEILFHVVNFNDYIGLPIKYLDKNTISKNRIVLEYENWKITIDKVSNRSELKKEFKENLGFAITNVGKLERTDNKNFTVNESYDILKTTKYFLSFARGLHVGIILISGYMNSGKKVCEIWNNERCDPWFYVRSWFPEHKPYKAVKCFSGFCEWWTNNIRDRQILFWFLEANNNLTLESRIVLGQIALERFYYLYFNKREYAHQQIRLLLEKFKIPNSIPELKTKIISKSVLTDITKIALLADKNNKKNSSIPIDMSFLIAEIRNDLAHPKQKYEDIDGNGLNTLSQFLFWYLELIFLATFNYDDVYFNRLQINSWAGTYESVPWNIPITE